jgi:hypothetical protein
MYLRELRWHGPDELEDHVAVSPHAVMEPMVETAHRDTVRKGVSPY